MLSYAGAKNTRSISVVTARRRRLDESRAPADPRLSTRGESDSARTTRYTATTLRCRTAAPPRGKGQAVGTESTCRSCHHCDTRYSAAMASQANRGEVRWERKARPRTANKGDRFSGSHCAHGDREPGLGLAE